MSRLPCPASAPASKLDRRLLAQQVQSPEPGKSSPLRSDAQSSTPVPGAIPHRLYTRFPAMQRDYQVLTLALYGRDLGLAPSVPDSFFRQIVPPVFNVNSPPEFLAVAPGAAIIA